MGVLPLLEVPIFLRVLVVEEESLCYALLTGFVVAWLFVELKFNFWCTASKALAWLASWY
jgi:hypothetical protein